MHDRERVCGLCLPVCMCLPACLSVCLSSVSVCFVFLCLCVCVCVCVCVCGYMQSSIRLYLQESALCAENNKTAERLIVEGRAQHKPLTLDSMYAATTRVQVSAPAHPYMRSACIAIYNPSFTFTAVLIWCLHSLSATCQKPCMCLLVEQGMGFEVFKLRQALGAQRRLCPSSSVPLCCLLSWSECGKGCLERCMIWWL